MKASIISAAKQQENSKVPEQLRPWQFQPGQSGNPSGRPKGALSLKEYAKRMLYEMTDDERMEYMKGLDKDLIWKMAEGNPKNDIEHSGTVTIAELLDNMENGSTIEGQTVENQPLIQDQEQEENANNLPAEQSPEPLQPTQVVEKYNPEE